MDAYDDGNLRRVEAAWPGSPHSYARAMVLAPPVMNLLPILIGVRADGHNELVAVGDGFRESADSWAEVL